MARQRHLRNAPITEALIDLRVQPSRRVDERTAEMLAKRLQNTYALKGPIRLNAWEVQFGEEPEARVATQLLGFRFHSADEKFVAQFQNEGFTLSRLAPYTEWEHIKSEAERLWPLYADVLRPERIRRIACRYINNLSLTMRQGQDFHDFLTAPPQVPPALPQMLNAFVQRVVIACPELNAITILTQLLEPNVATTLEKVPLILDIDVQCQKQFEPHSSEIWQNLNQLRGLKNAAFFESITETAAQLYE